MKKNVHEIDITIKGEDWEKALDASFKKKQKDVKIDGFRKGSVPKKIYLQKVGIESLYMDAIDGIVPVAYKKAIDENKLIPVAEPKLDITNVSKDEVSFKFTIITKPEIKLGDYKNLGIKKDTVKVSAKEIEEEIKKLQTKFAEIVDKDGKKAEKNDTATIDFEGYVDGKKLEGGSGQNYPLELGSNTFIPGFEDAVIGMEINEEKSVDLKFPENYTEELKNKDVTFKITLKGLKTKVLPELNEDFYLDLGYDDVKTEDDLKKKIKEQIKASKEKEADNKYTEDCVAKAAENMTIDLNEELIDEEIHHMMHNMEDRLKMQGLSLEQYMSFAGITHDDLHKQMKPEAEKSVKYRYLLEEVADKENIEVSDDEIKDRMEEIAKEYDMSVDEVKKEIASDDMIKYDIRMHKAIEIIQK